MIGAVGARGMSGPMPMRPPSPEEMFQRVDTDSDGQVSAAELEEMVANGPAGGASASDLLEQFDTNGDGQLSLEEMQAMHEAHRAEMEASRPDSRYQMSDLLDLLQSDEGQYMLKQLITELMAQFEASSSGAYAAEQNSSLVDLQG